MPAKEPRVNPQGERADGCGVHALGHQQQGQKGKDSVVAEGIEHAAQHGQQDRPVFEYGKGGKGIAACGLYRGCGGRASGGGRGIGAFAGFGKAAPRAVEPQARADGKRAVCQANGPPAGHGAHGIGRRKCRKRHQRNTPHITNGRKVAHGAAKARSVCVGGDVRKRKIMKYRKARHDQQHASACSCHAATRRKARPGSAGPNQPRANEAQPRHARNKGHRPGKAKVARKPASTKARSGAQGRAERYDQAHLCFAAAAGQRHERQDHRHGVKQAIYKNMVQIQHDKTCAGHHA